VSARGSFEYRTLVGSTDSEWGPGVYERPVMGLPVAGQHVWGAIQVGDRRVLLIRHFMNEMAGRFLTYEAPIGEDMVFRRSKGYSGLCEIGELDGQWGIYQPGTPPSFAFTTHGEQGRWVDGATDLTLRLHPTALQFATPDAEEPLAYFARAFDVTGGTFDGQPVDAGVVMHEQVYLSSGKGWMLSRHKRELQGAWIAFANRYADGSSEFGSVCAGTRGWQFAVVIASNGHHVLADRPAGKIRNRVGEIELRHVLFTTKNTKDTKGRGEGILLRDLPAVVENFFVKEFHRVLRNLGGGQPNQADGIIG